MAPLLASARSLVHLKGFGPTIRGGPPRALVAALAAADVVAWDGDDAEEGSFTSALLPLLAPDSRPRVLLAFKFADKQASFERSWGALVAVSRATVVCMLLERDALLARGAELADVGAARRFLDPAAAGDAARAALDSMPDWVPRYAALGVRGFEITRAALPASCAPLAALSWGGGLVVLIEWATLVSRSAADAPLWTHWCAHCGHKENRRRFSCTHTPL